MLRIGLACALVASLSVRPAAAEGVDFIDDAKLLYRVAACGNAVEPLPAVLTKGDPKTTKVLQKIVDGHCKRILDYMAKFRAQYFDKGRAWFDEVVPKTVPSTVVYPFGGGDLISALVAFPTATEITTISLEQSGDPRRISKLTVNQIDNSLGVLRRDIGGLISVGSNTSENLSAGQRNDLPGQVSSFLLGLVAGGYEPVSMRYFTFDDLGAIKYLEQADIDASDKEKGKSLKGDWQDPSFPRAFSNVEIQYRKIGDTAVRVHRHVGWNLGDSYLKSNPALIKHLEKKGKVTILTKGASYLLWRTDFSLIRNYMLDHLAWMLSDSTGIPPFYARQSNMVQETYGYYSGAFLEGAQDGRHDQAFMDLWRTSKKRKLPFRFGYVDKEKQAHLVVTRPKDK
ncbi:MAG: hypothetical protein H0T46_35800 [Deltaproteobacteria bacterium]|nr:hypothetical protein [Deltaproteobacteria bacterium]